MRLYSAPLALLGLVMGVKGDLHQLLVGTFGTEKLYTLEFDDVALTMALIGNYTASAASSWIALSVSIALLDREQFGSRTSPPLSAQPISDHLQHDKKNLYGTSFTTAPAFVSYTLGNATDILYNTTIEMGGNCSSSKAIFVLAATEAPYAVYGTPFGNTADCGAVYSVDEHGVLSELIQNYTYKSNSGVHGMAFDSTNSFIYSADDSANTLWTHKVDNATGELTFVSSISGPVTGADPRHVTVHPEGQYLYVILEGANKLAQYTIDPGTGIPSFENVTYPLIPFNASNSDYWSDEVALSFSNNYLWATSRARTTTNTGYISAFNLASNGSITSQLFLEPTTSSGGTANSVSPSDFSDKYVALTDSATRFVEIWSFASNGSAASVVAHVDIDDGGCCANAVVGLDSSLPLPTCGIGLMESNFDCLVVLLRRIVQCSADSFRRLSREGSNKSVLFTCFGAFHPMPPFLPFQGVRFLIVDVLLPCIQMNCLWSPSLRSVHELIPNEHSQVK